MQSDDIDKKTEFNNWLQSKVDEYREKETDAYDRKENIYNALKWEYIDIIEKFNKIFKNYCEE